MVSLRKQRFADVYGQSVASPLEGTKVTEGMGRLGRSALVAPTDDWDCTDRGKKTKADALRIRLSKRVKPRLEDNLRSKLQVERLARADTRRAIEIADDVTHDSAREARRAGCRNFATIR